MDGDISLYDISANTDSKGWNLRAGNKNLFSRHWKKICAPTQSVPNMNGAAELRQKFGIFCQTGFFDKTLLERFDFRFHHLGQFPPSVHFCFAQGDLEALGLGNADCGDTAGVQNFFVLFLEIIKERQVFFGVASGCREWKSTRQANRQSECMRRRKTAFSYGTPFAEVRSNIVGSTE